MTRIVAAGALALSAIAIAVIVGSSGGGTYELRATFADVRGLIAGGQIRAGGIQVGTVREIFLNHDDQPEVVMDVSDSYHVHRGAVANIELGSNAGVVNRVIALSEGDRRTSELPSGTTLGRGQTDQPVNFDEAAQTLNPTTRQNIRSFLAGLDKATRGRGGDIARTLTSSPAALNETANLLAQVNLDGAALRTMVGQGSRAVSALASSPQDIGAAVDRTADLLNTTASHGAELRASVALLGPALERTRVMLTGLARATPNLRSLVRGLNPLLDQLGPLAQLLPRAQRAAGPFLRATSQLVAGAPRSFPGLNQIVDAAFPVASTVGPLARSALPLGQALRAYGPEIAGLLQNFNSAIGGYDKAGHVLNLFVGFGPAPSTITHTIKGTDCGPGMLSLPYIRVPGADECQPWADFHQSYLTIPGSGG